MAETTVRFEAGRFVHAPGYPLTKCGKVPYWKRDRMIVGEGEVDCPSCVKVLKRWRERVHGGG